MMGDSGLQVATHSGLPTYGHPSRLADLLPTPDFRVVYPLNIDDSAPTAREARWRDTSWGDCSG